MSGYDDEGPAREYEETRAPRPGRALPAASIPPKLDRIEKHLALLGEQVERAEGQLAAVLRPERPTPVLGEVGNADRPDESDLALRLDSMAARLSGLGHRLSDVLDRVDL